MNKKSIWSIKSALKSFCFRIFTHFPIHDEVVVFESSSDYTDSSRVLSDYILSSNHSSSYKIFWIVDNPRQFPNDKVSALPKFVTGKNILPFIRSLYIQSIAKNCFYTHNLIGNYHRNDQNRVFITHASPPVKNSSGIFWNVNKNTHILSTSTFAAHYRTQTLGGGEEKVLITGLPRNDLLFGTNSCVVRKKLNATGKKLIVWMPTFKHHRSGRNDFSNSRIDNDISLMTYDNLKSLQQALAKNGIVLIIKPHPSQDMKYFYKEDGFNNIKIITNEDLEKKSIHPYELLGASDALITDFSSVYFDYLLVNKPIAFELSDKDKYEKGIGFIFDRPLDYMPGHKIYSIDDFKKFINDVANNKDPFRFEREKLRNLNHKYQDGHSTERVLEYFGLI